MSGSITFKSLGKHERNEDITVALYDVVHVGVETHLTETMRIEYYPQIEQLKGTLLFDFAHGSTVDEIRFKLADWCERLAETLRTNPGTPGPHLPLIIK